MKRIAFFLFFLCSMSQISVANALAAHSDSLATVYVYRPAAFALGAFKVSVNNGAHHVRLRPRQLDTLYLQPGTAHFEADALFTKNETLQLDLKAGEVVYLRLHDIQPEADFFVRVTLVEVTANTFWRDRSRKRPLW